MGKRQMWVSPEFLVALLKMREHRPRIYSVRGALPDDTRLVSVSTVFDGKPPQWPSEPGRAEPEGASLRLVLESDEWAGDLGGPIVLRPTVTVRHLTDAEIAALAQVSP